MRSFQSWKGAAVRLLGHDPGPRVLPRRLVEVPVEHEVSASVGHEVETVRGGTVSTADWLRFCHAVGSVSRWGTQLPEPP